MSKVVGYGLWGVTSSALVILYFLHFRQQKPLVYVDASRLLNQYQGMADARSAYQSKATVWQSNLDTLAAEVQQVSKEYQQERSSLTPKERELTEELIKTKQKQLADYQRAIGEQAQQEDAQMTRQVVDQINSFLKAYGEKKGYTIIIAATEFGNVAYADEGLDITEEVLNELNKRYSGR